MYLILHIFNLKSSLNAFIESFDGEMEPGSIVIFWMISSNPDIELEIRRKCTLVPETFYALEQFPESKFESMTTFPKLKVRWEGGIG